MASRIRACASRAAHHSSSAGSQRCPLGVGLGLIVEGATSSSKIESEGATLDRERIRSLARFLADGTPADELTISVSARAETASLVEPQRSVRHTTSRVAPLMTTGLGVAALATGLALYAIDEDPDRSGVKATYRDTAPAGVALGLSGLVAIGLGAWWLVHVGARAPAHTAPAAAWSPSASWIGISGAF